ncbi:AraC family transcriptional regulator [Burkholderia sp. Ac-20379]|uniref:AraC family transcriptional regulator n=1 Tax=Burkholderia sp. Ac-20379 TaxID=2703900 RepID=UPI0019809F3C|nr:AraC family transcriptional regulator [Burkholderia sp. Ac-20379]MBN3723933.1 AraC family transcriptional regulator [Burkholderia sp. Ac-20379]
MDLLSRLLDLMPVSGQLDARCHFGAPWRIESGEGTAREIHYHVLLSGEAVFEDDAGPPLAMRAGDIVMLPAGAEHVLHDGSGARSIPSAKQFIAGFELVSNDGGGARADVLCGRFLLPAMPRQLIRDHLPGRLLIRTAGEAPAGNRLTRLVELMREEANELGPGSMALVNHLSGALFALAMRFASESGEPPRGLLALAARPRLQPALSAMFDAPGHPWSLPELAALCHMSRATFARHFDEAIGRSASDLLTEIRMTMAGRMLAEGGMAVAEIGERVGYRSDAAFQRVFKRQTGLTPAQWRTQSRVRERDAPTEGEAART